MMLFFTFKAKLLSTLISIEKVKAYVSPHWQSTISASKLIQEGCYKRNIIETLSGPKAGSPIHKILHYNGCTVPENFFIKTRHEDIHMFEYPNTAIGSTRTRSTKEMLVY